MDEIATEHEILGEHSKLKKSFESLEEKLDALKKELVEEPSVNILAEEWDEDDVNTLEVYVKLHIKKKATLDEIIRLFGKYGIAALIIIGLLRTAAPS